ncbi:MAG: HEAT repeat domain-containing protein, partial [Tepidisphaeraceae bacterium]
MNDLPMPSDLKRDDAPAAPIVEPPSVKLIVRLFLIPLLIVGAAVGVMYLISLMAGSEVSFDQAVQRLKTPGGERTTQWLVGPGSKQRYLDAQALTEKMKTGLTEPQRIKLSGDLLDILRNYTRAEEGEIQHFVLLAMGRLWQRDPTQPEMDSPPAVAARERVLSAVLEYADAKDLSTRKAAVLATVYFSGYPESRQTIPKLVAKVRDEREDVDVRIAAATVLGPLGSPTDASVIQALQYAMRDTDPRNVELVWSAALSLAQLNQPDVADTILKLLSREELAQARVYDRENDPKNPEFRNLSKAEQERILINTMIGVEHYDVPAVQRKLK